MRKNDNVSNVSTNIFYSNHTPYSSFISTMRLLIIWTIYCATSYALSMNISRTALITGSTDGIGLTTAKNLAAKGYNVIIHGRNRQRISNAVEKVKAFTNISSGRLFTVEADLSTVHGCKQLIYSTQELLQKNGLSLDVLMNNAGVFEEKYTLTENNLEMTFAVNVMAPFVITSGLLPTLLDNTRQSRIVIASSISQCRSIDNWDDLQFHHRAYSSHRSYSESKLFDAMLAAEFATRLTKAGYGTSNITCNSLDPGTVNTKMLFAGWGPCGIDVDSALDETWLCTSEDVNDVTGTYFCWRSPSKSADRYKETERQKIWNVLSEIDPDSLKMWDL
jgi:NAD(P)-dependent dehydrogenase (short-subunit alcohol dehydrogenase family)